MPGSRDELHGNRKAHRQRSLTIQVLFTQTDVCVMFVIVQGNHLVECFFNKLKENRRITIQFDTLALRFLSFIYLGCIRILLA